MKIFDLNVPLETSPSEPLPVGVEHQSHQASAQFMAGFFGATVADLPHGYGWANDSVTMNAHSGTHVDAPWHYYPTCAEQPARTIDQMPLEWFYGDGVVLDFRDKERGGLINAADVQAALDKIGYALKPHDIVLIQTGADKFWGQPEYFNAGAGMTRRVHTLADRARHPHHGDRRLGLGPALLGDEGALPGDQATPPSSGRRTGSAATSSTATSRSWPTSTPCRGRTASKSPVSPSSWRAAAPAGRASWRSSKISSAAAIRVALFSPDQGRAIQFRL